MWHAVGVALLAVARLDDAVTGDLGFAVAPVGVEVGRPGAGAGGAQRGERQRAQPFRRRHRTLLEMGVADVG